MPTTTTGIATEFITFSRASNATVTDSDGRIKWAPHNLLLASEQFDASGWTKSGATVAANSVASPNGTTTADTFTASGGAAAAIIQVMPDVAGVCTVSIFAKAGTKSVLQFSAGAFAWGVNERANFNLANGTLGTVDASLTATITPVGNDWYRCSVTATKLASAGNLIWCIVDATTSAREAIATAGSVYLWGAHLYRSDLGGMQANTSAYPMYNPTTPKNLLGYTEDWSNTAWVKANIAAFGSGSIANAILAPNGLQTADKVVASNSASATRAVYQNFTPVSGSAYVVSVYAKAAEYSNLAIQEIGAGRFGASFNLVAQTATSLGGGGYVTSSITPISDGWFRCSVTWTASGGAAVTMIGYPAGATISAGGTSYAGDGTSGIYLWGAQLSDSASLDPYVPNHFTAPSAAAYYGPRRDFDPVTLACKGLLVEEQRANLTLHTAALENAAWTKVSSDAATKVTSPDGTSSANLVYPTSSTTFVGVRQILASGSYTSGVYTISVYAKAAGKNVLGIIDFAGSIGVAAYFTLTGSGTATNGLAGYTQSITPVGNGWYRCTMTSTSSWSNTNLLYTWIVVCDAVGSGAVTTSGTNGVQMYGTQTELGPFATSYIPVGATTAGATRLADVAQVSTAAFPYSDAEGTLVVATQYAGVGTGYQYSTGLSTGSGVSNIASLTSNSGVMGARVRSGGSDCLDANLVSAAVGGIRKVAIALKANDFAAVLNGGSPVTSITGAMPVGIVTLNSPAIGSQWIRQITYIPRRLTNAELQTRTA